MNEWLGSDLYLDASNIIKSLNDTLNSDIVYQGAIENETVSTACIQVALADVTILKIDKVSPQELVEVRKKFTEVNSLVFDRDLAFKDINGHMYGLTT